VLIGGQHDGYHFYRGHLCLLRACDCLRTGVYSLMTPWELILGSVMAVGLTVYLVYAMLRPEKF
jgi:K+-transporting ATPase KdpF subunit